LESLKALPGTKFFVFASLEHAEEFVRKNVPLQIWTATARGLESPPRRIGDPTHSIDILDFWQTNNRGQSYGVFAGYRTQQARCGRMSFASTSASHFISVDPTPGDHSRCLSRGPVIARFAPKALRGITRRAFFGAS
jgi:hypothetical protein